MSKKIVINEEGLEVAIELIKKTKVNVKKIKWIILLLIIQISLTIAMVGLENWYVVLPQLLEFIMMLERYEKEEELKIVEEKPDCNNCINKDRCKECVDMDLFQKQ